MNYDTIMTILGMATLMNLVHKTELYHKFLEALLLDVKPFNCVMCSTFWVTLIVNVIPLGWSAIFISSIAAIVAEIINIQIHKI